MKPRRVSFFLKCWTDEVGSSQHIFLSLNSVNCQSLASSHAFCVKDRKKLEQKVHDWWQNPLHDLMRSDCSTGLNERNSSLSVLDKINTRVFARRINFNFSWGTEDCCSLFSRWFMLGYCAVDDPQHCEDSCQHKNTFSNHKWLLREMMGWKWEQTFCSHQSCCPRLFVLHLTRIKSTCLMYGAIKQIYDLKLELQRKYVRYGLRCRRKETSSTAKYTN